MHKRFRRITNLPYVIANINRDLTDFYKENTNYRAYYLCITCTICSATSQPEKRYLRYIPSLIDIVIKFPYTLLTIGVTNCDFVEPDISLIFLGGLKKHVGHYFNE